MARPKKTQTVKTYSLVEEAKLLLASGENVIAVCKDIPLNNSGGLVIGCDYAVTETTEFCGNRYVSILTPKGCFWYYESHFELICNAEINKGE